MHLVSLRVVRRLLSVIAVLQILSGMERQCVGQTSDPALPAPFEVEYTGALFGYYQINAAYGGPDLTPVTEFLHRRSLQRKTLLVGMGDNFAPEFRASIQMEKPVKDSDCDVPFAGRGLKLRDDQKYPQVLYKNDDRFPKKSLVHCDNVAAFLMDAGYRAVVPGREDFLYTATWLRAIALGFRWASEPPVATGGIKNSEHRLSLLAANLRIVKAKPTVSARMASTVAAGPGSLPPQRLEVKGDECPLLFSYKRGNGSTPPVTKCTNDANTQTTTAMDWLDRLDLSLDQNSGVDDRINEETGLGHQQDAIHEPTGDELRRTLMENQSLEMLSMVDGVDDQRFSDDSAKFSAIRTALEALSKDDAYFLDERRVLNERRGPGLTLGQVTHGASGKRTMSGGDALASLRKNLSDLKVVAVSDGDSRSDFRDFGYALVAKFSDLGQAKLLLDPPIRRKGRRMLLRAIASEQRNVGYTISQPRADGTGEPEGPATLIVGIVGQETMRAVSPTNLILGGKGSIPEEDGGLAGQVSTQDPLRTLKAVVRGAMQLALDAKEGSTGDHFDRIVVMAQMPREESEVLGAQWRDSLKTSRRVAGDDRSIVDVSVIPVLLLSEAQADRSSPDLTMKFAAGAMLPVLTPHPPYEAELGLWNPESMARMHFGSRKKAAETFEAILTNDAPMLPAETTAHGSTLYFLLDEMTRLRNENKLLTAKPDSCDGMLNEMKLTGSAAEKRCMRDLNAMLLNAMRPGDRHWPGGDNAILEQRDVFYGNLPKDYTGYDVCHQDDKAAAPYVDRCKLRVALDRVLWKGDYEERVMVTGSDLATMLSISQQQGLTESSLEPTDVSGQSLATFGFVQPSSPNLSKPGSGSERFPIAQDSVCGTEAKSSTEVSKYCINGQPIRADGSYWIVTSDHLANDKLLYKVLAASIEDGYHETSVEYVTGAIADHLLVSPKATAVVASSKATPVVTLKTQEEAKKAEWKQQLRPLFHLDIGKLVAGFSGREPENGNVYAENFQGAADSRASAASQQELDLESLSRYSLDLPVDRNNWLFKDEQLAASIGVQTDIEYDRTATGNLTNKPETVIYAQNSLTTGPFVQVRMPQWKGLRGTSPLHSGRSVPRTLLVLSPVQYQTQLASGVLVFPFSASPPATTPPTVASQFTVRLPKSTSLFEKVGLRKEIKGDRWFEAGPGSYAEGGYENGTQRDVLASVTLSSDGITAPPCSANSATTISACFAGYANTKSPTYIKGFQIDDTTKLLALTTATQHTQGVYWDVHMVRSLFKSKSGDANAGSKAGINLMLDSKADLFSPRDSTHALNTQTQYAIPLSASLNFPVLRNFSLSPTYTGFFYSSQVTGQSIRMRGLLITAKWYFARDATVPLVRDLYFRGPASADQTSSAKLK
jgi:hypothetical protein